MSSGRDLSSLFVVGAPFGPLPARLDWATGANIGDVNHDGRADALPWTDSIATRARACLVRGAEDGGYALPAWFTPREAVSADFNGDGVDDVHLACTGPDAQAAPGEPDVLMLPDGEGG